MWQGSIALTTCSAVGCKALKWSVVFIAVVLSFSAEVDGGRCSRSVSVQQSYKQTCSYSQSDYYYSKCGFLNWDRCTRRRYLRRYQLCSHTNYRTVYSISYYCCSGWTGSSCSTPVCSPSCQNGGRCSSPGRCSCRTGYGGNRCQTPVCSPACQNGGTCSSPGRCTCRAGYTGNQCQTPICNPVCSNDGQCSRPGVCTCPDEYSGGRCQTPKCSPSCMHHGTCIGPGICSCLSGYTGEACEEEVSITCPPDVAKPVGKSLDAIVQWDLPEVEGGDNSIRLLTNYQPGSLFPIGITDVIYSVFGTRDILTTSCTFSVEVFAVNITCPEDMNVPNEHTVNYTIVTWDVPQEQGGADLVRTNSSRLPGTKFYLGTTTVVYTVYALDGEIVTECSFELKIVDTEAPRITCPNNTSVLTGHGKGAHVIWNEPHTVENSGKMTVTSSHQSDDIFPLGDTVVTYKATDPSGNNGTCSFLVTVAGVTISCPDDIQTQNAMNVDNTIVQWNEPLANGGDELVRTNASHWPGMRFPIGATVVTYNVVTTEGRRVTGCRFNITVEDAEKPEVICPEDVSILAGPDTKPVITWKNPVSNDNSGYVTVSSSYQSGTTFLVGSTVVNYTAIDPSGNTNMCEFYVNVTEVRIVCPADIHKPIDAATLSTVVVWEPPITQGGEGHIHVIGSSAPATEFSVGSTVVTYDVLDDRYIPVTVCNFTVQIYGISLRCPSDIEIPTETGSDAADVVWDPPAAVGGKKYVNVSSYYKPGDSFHIGMTTVIYQAHSLSDDVVTNCSFYVTVLDDENPVITCADDVLVFTDASIQPVVSWAEPNATDNSRDTNITCSHISGAVFPVGVHQVNCTAWDPYGNRNGCHFHVHVEGIRIYCPANVSTVINQATTTAVVTWDRPAVFGGLNQTNLTVNQSPGTEFSVGLTMVEYIVYGPELQWITSCSFAIFVYDPDNPLVVCPDDLHELTERGRQKEIFWQLPQVFDFSGTAIITYRSHAPGMPFTEGVTKIQYEATDFMGKTGRCSFSVTVEGVEIICPRNVTTTTDFRSAFAGVLLNAPEVIGGKGLVEVKNVTEELYQMFPVGDSVITYNVYDTDGTVLTHCTFEVHVDDNESPVVICPDDQVVIVEPLEVPSVSWNMPFVTDNTGVVRTITSSFKPGDTFEIGVTNVSYVAQDESGNTNECSFHVIVEEVIMDCPADFSTISDRGLSFATNVSWPHPILQGTSEQLELTSNLPHGNVFAIGNHTIVYTASKGPAFSTTCNFTISVHDTELPLIRCPADISIQLLSGNTSAQATWEPVLASDNSGQGVQVNSNHISGETFHSGSSVVIYTAVDRSGNVASCHFNISISTLCPDDRLFISNIGDLLWPASDTETVVESNKKCPIDTYNSHNPIATRRCLSDDHLGAVWEDVMLSDCGDNIILTLDRLADIPVELTNVVEVADALSDLTTDLKSISSHEVVEIVQAMRNIVDLEETLPQVASALVDTTSAILSANLSHPCHSENKDVLSTEILLKMLKSVDHQLTVSSRSGEEIVVHDGVFFDSLAIDIRRRNSTENVVSFNIKLSDDSHVKVWTNVSEEWTPAANVTDQGTVQATLSVYARNDEQLTTQSLKENKCAIVSPLVSMRMEHADLECDIQKHPVIVKIPFNTERSGDKYLLNDTVRCVVIEDNHNEYLSFVDNCNTLNITRNMISCRCDKLGVYVVLMDYQCHQEIEQEITFVLIGMVACYMSVIALFCSIVIVLSIRSWQLASHQQILFYLYLSLFCLYAIVLLIGHVTNLPFGCVIVKSFLHYFILTALLWFAAEAQSIYISAVKMDIVESRYFIPSYCATAWLLPIAFVGISIWLRSDKISTNMTCTLTDDVVGHFTLTLPVCMILLHNTIVYFLTAVRFLKVSSYYPMKSSLCIRFGEALCVFTMAFIAMSSGYYWIVTGTSMYQLTFSVASIASSVFILSVSCMRRARSRYHQSGMYHVNNASVSSEKENGADSKVYFSPVDEVEMADVRFAQENARDRQITESENTDDESTSIVGEDYNFGLATLFEPNCMSESNVDDVQNNQTSDYK